MRYRLERKMSVAILVSTVCFLSATVSMAAVADEADQSEEASALEEVIVSARKREESLQDEIGRAHV